MKPREFLKIMIEYADEDRRWNTLKVGDVIYEELCAGTEFEYAKMIIKKIDLEERTVYAQDVTGHHVATLSSFLTEEEFNKLNKR